MPSQSGADALLELLSNEGVQLVFGNPGTTELPLCDRLVGRHQFRLVLALQESVAVAMADGYARASRRASFVNLHVAPGLANGLGNTYNALRSRVPMVVTAGQQDTRHLCQEPMLAADLVAMAQPVTKWAGEARHPKDVPILAGRAFRLASAYPEGPVFLSLPSDVMEAVADIETSVPPRGHADPCAAREDLEEAARTLLGAEKPLLILGDGVVRAGAVGAGIRLAEVLGAGVMADTLSGEAPFPFRHPLFRGAPLPVNSALPATLAPYDVVLVVAADLVYPFYYSEADPTPGAIPVIQLEPIADRVGRVFNASLTLIGGLTSTLDELASLIGSLATPEYRRRAEERLADAAAERENALLPARAALTANETTPINPQHACMLIADSLEPGTLVFDEAVSSSLYMRSWLKCAPGEYHFARGGGIGWGMGAAVGAKLAAPDRPVVAVVGDGSALYAPQALWNAAHDGAPTLTIVLNNHEYHILKQGLAAMGRRAAEAWQFPGMDIRAPEIDFEALSLSFGSAYMRAETSREIGHAVRAALSSVQPVLLEIPVAGMGERPQQTP